VSCYFLEATAFAKLFVQEQGTDALIRLMEAVEDNRKRLSAAVSAPAGSPRKTRQRRWIFCDSKPRAWCNSR